MKTILDSEYRSDAVEDFSDFLGKYINSKGDELRQIDYLGKIKIIVEIVEIPED